MKRIIFCFLLVFILAPVFSEEINYPGFVYAFVIRNQEDEATALSTIKAWIAKYKNYNCSISNAPNGSNAEMGALTIETKINPNQRSEIAICRLYLKGKLVTTTLSVDEVYGLTQRYSLEQIDEVYDRVYSLYYYNMR